MQRIVVGIDGSEGSAEALRWALELAALKGDEVVALHAYPPVAFAPYVAVDCGYLPYDEGLAEVVAEVVAERAGQLLDEVVDRVATEVGGDVKVIREVVPGNPAQVLLDAGRSAGHVVVGSRGLSGLREVLLGSVSHRVATHATCPVTIVPSGR